MRAVCLFLIFAAVAFCDTEKKIWDYIYKGVGNKYGAAGIMGNLYAESQFNPTNIQNTYEKKYGNDATYTANVDSGKYKNFIKDKAGYGLAQWTHWSKKELLLKYAQEHKKSIGDLDMQLEFLIFDLKTNHKKLWKNLQGATSCKEASNLVLLGYERPASKDTPETQKRRADFAQQFYDKYAKADTALDTLKEAEVKEEPKEEPVSEPEKAENVEETVEGSEEKEPAEKKKNDISFKTLKGATFYHGREFKKGEARWIVVHYTAMPGVGAEACTKSFNSKKTDRKVSTHFFCDSKEVYSVVDEKYVAWHVGNGNVQLGNKSLAKIVAHGDAKDWRYKLAAENHIRWQKAKDDFKGNFMSFGVDLCCIKASKTRKATDQDWDFHPDTVINAAKTVAYLCNKYNIDLDHVIRHGDATGKPCPRPFVSLPKDDDPTKNDKRWEEFKATVKSYL